MKKSIFLVFVFMIFGSISYSQEFNKPFKFYVFGMDEAGAIFTQAMPFFESMGKGKQIDQAKLENLFNFAYSNQKTELDMTKCFLKAHFRGSENKAVQKFIKSKFNKVIPKNESEAINYRYNSKLVPISNSQVKYVYKKVQDEDIRFDYPSRFANKDKTVVMYFPYSNLQASAAFSASPKKEVYMAGGQTATIKLKIMKEKYKKLPAKIKSSKDYIRYDISNYGVMKHNNAKKTVLEFVENTKDLFIFNLKMYDEDTKLVYTLRYEYTISSANMNYKIFDQLKKHLLYYSFFSYIAK